MKKEKEEEKYCKGTSFEQKKMEIIELLADRLKNLNKANKKIYKILIH